MGKPSIGFIGQGYVGKNYADNLEERGYVVTRFALEDPYKTTKDKIRDCDIVFIAVPTPSHKDGFDGSIVEGVLTLVGEGKIAVIKSTVVPGFTSQMQKKFPKITLLFSPEFLTASRARADVDAPFETIVGMPVSDAAHEAAAKQVHEVLPSAPYTLTTTSENAEIIKYAHNTFAYSKLVIMNIYYDLAQKFGGNWKDIEEALKHAPFVGPYHLDVIHKSGRGAGGYCLIKDFAALRALYEKMSPEDAPGLAALRGLEQKNIDLLQNSGKDLDLLKGVYGDKSSV